MDHFVYHFFVTVESISDEQRVMEICIFVRVSHKQYVIDSLIGGTYA